METWTSLEVAKLFTSFVTPIVITWLGLTFSRHLKSMEQASEDQHRLKAEEKEKARMELERRYEHHIEFTIETNIFGPQKGFYIAEFVIAANNKSLIRHQFNEIFLRVLGIKEDGKLELRYPEKDASRLNFPEEILKTDIIPSKWTHIFIEPGVKQQITYTTRIPENIRFITVHAKFHYDEFTPHSIEHIFEVKPSQK